MSVIFGERAIALTQYARLSPYRPRRYGRWLRLWARYAARIRLAPLASVTSSRFAASMRRPALTFIERLEKSRRIEPERAKSRDRRVLSPKGRESADQGGVLSPKGRKAATGAYRATFGARKRGQTRECGLQKRHAHCKSRPGAFRCVSKRPLSPFVHTFTQGYSNEFQRISFYKRIRDRGTSR